MKIDPRFILEALIALMGIAERMFSKRGQGEEKKAFVLNALKPVTTDPEAIAGAVDAAAPLLFPKPVPMPKGRDFTKALGDKS